MAIPDYQTLMLPLLQLTSDGTEHKLRDVVDSLAKQMGLADEERSQLLPSGRQTTFDNRVHWARTYLAKAGLLEATRRGFFRITHRGTAALDDAPSRIDVPYLMRFPEFVEFKARSRASQAPRRPGQAATSSEVDAAENPEEALERHYQALRDDLAQELLEHAKRGSPEFFERLVVDLIVAMGYGGSRKDAGAAVGRSGDGGIDGVIKEDKLGLDSVYLQAKRWEATVGRPVVQAFAGSLEGHGANKGIVITTSKFSREAQDYVTRIQKRIVLIDGHQLGDLMIDHGVAVSEVAQYAVKRLDADYFEED